MIAPEPVAWMGRWEAGVRITMDRQFAEEWVLDGAVVTPLYPGPMTWQYIGNGGPLRDASTAWRRRLVGEWEEIK